MIDIYRQFHSLSYNLEECYWFYGSILCAVPLSSNVELSNSAADSINLEQPHLGQMLMRWVGGGWYSIFEGK